jgi:hypothetical protein
MYREGNFVADKLANFDLSVTDFIWWNSVPPNIRDDLAKIRDGHTYYRFY